MSRKDIFTVFLAIAAVAAIVGAGMYFNKEQEDALLLLDAQLNYSAVQLEEKSDAEGRAYFQKLPKDKADRLAMLLQDKLRQSELDFNDPKKHYDAECMHSFGQCKIKSNIKNYSEVYGYMLMARN